MTDLSERHLTRVSVEGFCGFLDRQEIRPAVPNGELGSGLTICVGPNNSGKTSFLECFNFLKDVRPLMLDRAKRHASHPFRLELENSLAELRTFYISDDSALVLTEGQQAYPNVDHMRVIPSRRVWSAYSSGSAQAESAYWTDSNQIDRKGGNTNLLVRLAKIIEQDKKGEFDKLLRRIDRRLHAWKLEYGGQGQYIEYTTPNGSVHASDMLGDGVTSLFRIGVALFDASLDTIIIIDEPELSLHPEGQKNLARVLSEVSANRQLIICTHSPKFISWRDLERGARLYRFTIQNGGIRVVELDEGAREQLSALAFNWQKPQQLDEVAREVFFANQIVFVEGQQDVGLFRLYGEQKKLSDLPLFGYGAGGADAIPMLLKLSRSFGIRAAAIFDGNYSELANEMRSLYPEAKILDLPTDDIRDKWDAEKSTNLETVGLFNKSGEIKPEYDADMKSIYSKLLDFFEEEFQSCANT